MIVGFVKGIHHVGWALVILGLVAAVAPLATGIAIAVVIGLVLLAAGALIGLFGLRARSAGKGNTGLVIGALTALCGLVLVVQPTAGLSLVRLVLAVYFLASGASEVAMAWQLRPEEDWGWTLVGGIVSMLAAVVLWTGWPISSARTVGVLVGAKLVSTGWAIVRFHGRLESIGGKVAKLRARLR